VYLTGEKMGILVWMGTGLGIALLANWQLPPRNRNGVIISKASGILGAVVGGYASTGTTESLVLMNGAGWIFAGVGAMLAILCVELGKSMLYIEH